MVAVLVASTATARAASTESLRPGGPPTVGGMKVLFGNLHDHSTDSDGHASSARVAQWFKKNHEALGMDFETLSDHSDFFPLAPLAHTAKPVWSRQGKLLRSLSDKDFSFLRGFEWTNDQQD